MQWIFDNLIFLFPLLIFTILIGLHVVATQVSLKKKQLLIISLSSLLILHLDVFSYILLTSISTLLLATIKKKVDLGKVIYPLTLLLIFILLILKDYWVIFNVKNIYVPLGLSYYYFRLLSLLIEYSKRPKELYKIDIWHYYTYIYFFPIFLAGPIHRFNDFKMLKPTNYFKLYKWLLGALLLKLLLVDMTLYYLVYKYLLVKVNTLTYIDQSYIKTIGTVSLFGFTAFLHAYMDLMLYTEMSKSLSRILGFTVQENFNRPLLASNISKFWQSWHISLSNWTRDYIFFPTLLKTKKVWLSTYASMLTIGLWHSATLNWIIWALLHATALNFYGKLKEQTFFKNICMNQFGNAVLHVLGNIITIYFVSIVFIFIAIHDFKQAVSYIAMIFGL